MDEIMVEEASTLAGKGVPGFGFRDTLGGFPRILQIDGVSMPYVRIVRDGEGDIMAVVYRRPDGGEFHVLND